MAAFAALLLVLAPVPAHAHAQPPGTPGCQPPAPTGSELPRQASQDPVIGRLALDRAHEIANGAGVLVGVVDTGIGWHHPKLGAAVVPQPGVEIGQDGVPVPGRPLDCTGHGTAVAGLIAAHVGDDNRVYGVAPEARIYPVRFGTDIQSLPRPFIAAGIRNAVDNHVRVLNLSFALPVDDPALREAIAYAVSQDVVVVAAAGNEQQSEPGRPWYPAAYPGVLAVAAVDQTGQPLAQSNEADWVGIAAPGENLTTLAPDSGYLTQSGTSFAAPIVAGSAALLVQRFPGITAAQVIDRLKASAVRDTGAVNRKTGAGVVDPYGALTAPGPSAGVPGKGKPGAIAVAPSAAAESVLSPTTATALVWTGLLAALAVLAALASTAIRRAAKRGWTPGGRRTASVAEPEEEPAETPLL